MGKTESASNLIPIRAGFIPLVDCAVLAVAREKGFAAAHGIDLQLFKEVSWANIRDRVNIGQFDVAHMLAGMPIAANMGIGHIKVLMIAPMALGAGGSHHAQLWPIRGFGSVGAGLAHAPRFERRFARRR